MPDGSMVRVFPGGRTEPYQMPPIDWARLDAMTDAEITARAKSDPDAQPLTSRQLRAMKPLYPPAKAQPRSIRRKLKMSQATFASLFGFSLRTVQEWEQGRRKPNRTARMLLKIIDREPDAVRRALQS